MDREILCFMCVHFNKASAKKKPYSCAAFPKGIPAEVLWGEHAHRTHIDGDGGLLYEQQGGAR